MLEAHAESEIFTVQKLFQEIKWKKGGIFNFYLTKDAGNNCAGDSSKILMTSS